MHHPKAHGVNGTEKPAVLRWRGGVAAIADGPPHITYPSGGLLGSHLLTFMHSGATPAVPLEAADGKIVAGD